MLIPFPSMQWRGHFSSCLPGYDDDVRCDVRASKKKTKWNEMNVHKEILKIFRILLRALRMVGLPEESHAADKIRIRLQKA
jgi:hypothetical protein